MIVFGLIGVLVAGATSPAVSEWLPVSRMADVSVIVAEDASPAERFAAEEFAKYWDATTKHVVQVAHAPESRAVVWIGARGTPAELLDQMDLEGLGDDGICLKTFSSSDGATKQLVIAGGARRGALYGVYEFFERYMGVRWFTPDLTYTPEATDAVPSIDYRYVPPIPYRDTNYRPFLMDPYFALVHRLNGQSVSIPDERGGTTRYLGGFGHTFFDFVSPQEYGVSHPEYFSEIAGKRVVDPKATQLCLTDPDVLRIVIEKVRALLASRSPDQRIVSITQMDWPHWCECETCRAIDEAEESHAGTVINFVNQVAEAIESDYPDVFIDTFAYTYTRKPPRTLKARDNVIVRLCSIECDFARPLADPDSDLNRQFQDDIRKWAKIAKHLFIWDYTQNWYCFQGPHPNFHVLQPNVQFYAQSGVSGLYEQASPTSPHSDYEFLKAYILGRALWNPDVDWHTCYDEFLDAYYQDAAPYIRAYHRLITDKVLADGYLMTIFSQMEWMDYDTVVKAKAIFDEAFASTGNPEIQERLKSAYVPVQYAALVCPPRVEFSGDSYQLARPPSQTFDEYWSMLEAYGVTALGDTTIDDFLIRLGGKTPPRNQTVDIVKLQNAHSEVWVAPTYYGAVLRWIDKDTGKDLLGGYKTFAAYRGLMMEWDKDAPRQMNPFYPPADEYEVRASDSEHLTLRALTEDGFEIVRDMALDPNSCALAWTVHLTNLGTEPAKPHIILHTEFWLKEDVPAEIWTEGPEARARVSLHPVERGIVWGADVDTSGVSRWGFDAPGGPSIEATLSPDEATSGFYVVNLNYDHVVLQLHPLPTPIPPGETRTLSSVYSVAAQP